MRLALVHMPWGALERPALGLSLLQAGLADYTGVESELHYLNMRFADAVGSERYQWVTHDLPHIALSGEWVFTESLYGPDPQRDARYIDDILRRQWRLTNEQIDVLIALRSHVEPFLEGVIEAYDWAGIDLVGFSSTFEQNIASMALAQRLKKRFPAIITIFGGANWEAAMGQEYHRAFQFVDLVCSGEAELSFPRVIEALRGSKARRTRRLRSIPGVVLRDRGKSHATGPGTPVERMDDLPVPDYSSYFGARAASAAAAQVAPVLLFETSRGCWWGAKSHCTFCGLNGHSMSFRSKSAHRVLKEVGDLVRQWPCPTLEAVDNILDMRYFDTVLPALERMDLPGPVFFEIKANLRRHHVAALRRAQILRIQPGIESLSDHVLQLMRKGTTALRNVQLLKWCREYEIAVDWNLLYGFPGETDDDYRQIIALLQRITHLQMPGACGPVRLDRFSPYFESAESFCLRNVRPLSVYSFIYPVGGLRHDRVAYYFEFDYGPGSGPSRLAQEAAALATTLREEDTGARLQAMPCVDGGLHIHDSRPGASASSLRLSPYERCIVERLDEVASLSQVMEALRLSFPNVKFDETNVRRFIGELESFGMVLGDTSGHYLGLALMPRSMRSTLERASRRGNPEGRRTIPITMQA